MTDMSLIDGLKATSKSAHECYLETWSIITEGAENDGKYSDELLYRVIENQQKIASDLQHLAHLTETLTEHFEKITNNTNNTNNTIPLH